MPVDDIIKLSVILSLVVLPAMAITARFALKPIVDAILRLKESGLLPTGAANAGAASQDVPALTAEVRLLRDEMAQLQQTVMQLQDAETFHRTLIEPAGPPALAPGPNPQAMER